VRRNWRIFSFIGETFRETTASESRSNFTGVAAAFIGGDSAHDELRDGWLLQIVRHDEMDAASYVASVNSCVSVQKRLAHIWDLAN